MITLLRRLVPLCLAVGILAGLYAALPFDASAQAAPVVEAEPAPDLAPLPADPIGDGECDELCAVKARNAYRRCIGAGGTEDECTALSQRTRRQCLAECPKREPRDPPKPVPPRKPRERLSCEDSCHERVRKMRRLCMSKVGNENLCDRKARAALDTCLKRCKRPETEPRDCQGKCEAFARKVFDRCIAGSTSNDRTECARRARAALGDCLKRCDRPEPEPLACQERCKAYSQKVFDRCMEGPGANRGQCQKEQREALTTCLERCDRP